MYNLTIAVITYNRANYLKEMLDSILQQTYKDFYVIIYDNCSEDNTTETVKSYLSDERFSYHRHTANIGANNINYALNNCTTDYLIIAHDDDVMLPDMVKREIAVFDSYDDISLVWTNINHIDINSKIIETSISSPSLNNQDCIIKSKEYIKTLSSKGNLINCPTVMFRMSIIKANNLSFRREIGGACDCYLWLEINQLNYNFYYINTPLYNYRLHNLQDSHNTLKLFPLLRKPVYNLLVENKYPDNIIKSWLRKVENDTLDEICKNKITNKSFLTIKNDVLFRDKKDFFFLGKIYFLLPFKRFYNLTKRIIKKSIVYKRLYNKQ